MLFNLSPAPAPATSRPAGLHLVDVAQLDAGSGGAGEILAGLHLVDVASTPAPARPSIKSQEDARREA